MTKLRTVRELIDLSSDYLSKHDCQTPRLDAEILLAYVLNTQRLNLYMNLDYPLEQDQLREYRRLIGLRGQRIPVAYLIGRKEFYTKDFMIDRNVLVPRPETEFLVDQAIRIGQDYAAPQILDLGTGSGIIAISIALALPTAKILAADISPAALEIAKKNAEQLDVIQRLSFLRSDMFTHFPPKRFDVICSNPPYIPTDDLDKLEKEIEFEPKEALDGGPDGLKYHRELIQNSPSFLASRGSLIVEIGSDQAEQVETLAKGRGFIHVKTVQDYAGKDRVVILQWN